MASLCVLGFWDECHGFPLCAWVLGWVSWLPSVCLGSGPCLRRSHNLISKQTCSGQHFVQSNTHGHALLKWHSERLCVHARTHAVHVSFLSPDPGLCPRVLSRAIPENRGIQKMEIQFSSIENYSMSTSFGKKLVTLSVTAKMLKLVDNAVFDGKKLNFMFFISRFFGFCPCHWTRIPGPLEGSFSTFRKI